MCTMDIDSILKQLQTVEEALKCTICSKKCVDPVKIRACGHYFCSKCFKIKDHVCPACNTFYEERDVVHNNIAKETDCLISELKDYLLEPDSESASFTKSCSNEPIVTPNAVQSIENTFVYNNKTYHVNYIDSVCNKVNAKGETPLHIACKRKRLDEVITLIEKKTDLNVKDFAGWAPLHEAVQSGSVEIVDILLKNGALADIPGEEYITPLHKAVTVENRVLIELLLRYRADKEKIDYLGKKPVDYTRNEDIKNLFTTSITTVDMAQELFCRKKINVYFYYIEEPYKQKLSASKFVNVLKEYIAKKVTHFIIRRTHKLSLKIMVAMLDGCYLFPQEWIDDFLQNNYFIPIPNYVFISKPELNEGLRKAMLNSLIKLPKLFDGMYFFIHGHNNQVVIHNLRLSKSSIILLINSGGGKILHRAPTPSTCENIFNYPYHSNTNGKVSRCCHYLIYEEDHPPTLQYQMAEIKHRTSKWLLDCIINFTILP